MRLTISEIVKMKVLFFTSFLCASIFPIYSFSSGLDELIYSESVVSELYYYSGNIDYRSAGKKRTSSKKSIVINFKKNEYINRRLASWVYSELLAHYMPVKNEPAYFKQDLKEIATYYSQFPDAMFLMASIKGKKWHISYGEKKSVTRATGTSLEVDKAEVYFDTRAAMLSHKSRKCKGRRICVSSPADILLHELIHVSTMLNGRQFIYDGGMQMLMYPYVHEQKVLKLESELYKRMSLVDKIKRPSRKTHNGKYIFSSCALCVD